MKYERLSYELNFEFFFLTKEIFKSIFEQLFQNVQGNPMIFICGTTISSDEDRITFWEADEYL